MSAPKFVMVAVAVVAVISVATATPLVAQSNITGEWDATVQSMQGTNTVRIAFKQDGEKVSGVLKSPMGELPFEGGSIVGSDLKFGFTVPVQGQVLEITMTGTVDGSSITGKAQFGGLGEGDWTAKRVESSSTAASAAPPAGLPPAPPAAPAPSTSAGGVSGKWDITVKTDNGDVPIAAELSETGGKISGTVTGPAGSFDVEGTVEGAALKIAFVAKTPQGDIPVSMSGEFSGDAIVNGKADFGGMGQGEWSAKRRP